MSVKVRLPGSLRDATGGVTRIAAAGTTLAAVVADLVQQYPALQGKILDERGGLQSYLNVYIGDQDARHVGGGDAAVPDDADVMVIPAMSGGAIADESVGSQQPALVDARGSVCPTPIVRLATTVKGAPVGGLIELLATDPGCESDVRAWSRQTGHEVVLVSQAGAELRFVIRRVR